MNDAGTTRSLGRFLTVADTAQQLNISVSSVRAPALGRVVAIRIGS